MGIPTHGSRHAQIRSVTVDSGHDPEFGPHLDQTYHLRCMAGIGDAVGIEPKFPGYCVTVPVPSGVGVINLLSKYSHEISAKA